MLKYFTRKPKNRFSVEHLLSLVNQLEKNKTIKDGNKKLVIESLREIAELLIWGDQHDTIFFEVFLEKDILKYFLSIMVQTTGKEVKIQLLQTLSILVENLKRDTSIYFLLSNNHINELIIHQFDFSDEEVLAYYISFLKTLSLKLNPSTLQFFFNKDKNDFPLYTEALKFFAHPDSMVRISVRSITLNVYKVEDEEMRNFIFDKAAVPYFNNIVWFICDQCTTLDELVISSNHQNYSRLQGVVDELLDVFYYINDIINLGIDSLNNVLVEQMLTHLLIPLFRGSLLIDDELEDRICPPLALFLLSQVLHIFTHTTLVNVLGGALVHPRPHKYVTDFLAGITGSATTHNTASIASSTPSCNSFSSSSSSSTPSSPRSSTNNPTGRLSISAGLSHESAPFPGIPLYSTPREAGDDMEGVKENNASLEETKHSPTSHVVEDQELEESSHAYLFHLDPAPARNRHRDTLLLFLEDQDDRMSLGVLTVLYALISNSGTDKQLLQASDLFPCRLTKAKALLEALVSDGESGPSTLDACWSEATTADSHSLFTDETGVSDDEKEEEIFLHENEPTGAKDEDDDDEKEAIVKDGEQKKEDEEKEDGDKEDEENSDPKKLNVQDANVEKCDGDDAEADDDERSAHQEKDKSEESEKDTPEEPEEKKEMKDTPEEYEKKDTSKDTPEDTEKKDIPVDSSLEMEKKDEEEEKDEDGKEEKDEEKDEDKDKEEKDKEEKDKEDKDKEEESFKTPVFRTIGGNTRSRGDTGRLRNRLAFKLGVSAAQTDGSSTPTDDDQSVGDDGPRKAHHLHQDGVDGDVKDKHGSAVARGSDGGDAADEKGLVDDGKDNKSSRGLKKAATSGASEGNEEEEKGGRAERRRKIRVAISSWMGEALTSPSKSARGPTPSRKRTSRRDNNPSASGSFFLKMSSGSSRGPRGGRKRISHRRNVSMVSMQEIGHGVVAPSSSRWHAQGTYNTGSLRRHGMNKGRARRHHASSTNVRARRRRSKKRTPSATFNVKIPSVKGWAAAALRLVANPSRYRLVTLQLVSAVVRQLRHPSSKSDNAATHHIVPPLRKDEAEWLRVAVDASTRNVRTHLCGSLGGRFLILFQEEYKKTRTLHFSRVVTHPALCYPIAEAAKISTLAMEMRLPRGEAEQTRRAIQTFLVIRELQLALHGRKDKVLPLKEGSPSGIRVGDPLDAGTPLWDDCVCCVRVMDREDVEGSLASACRLLLRGTELVVFEQSRRDESEETPHHSHRGDMDGPSSPSPSPSHTPASSSALRTHSGGDESSGGGGSSYISSSPPRESALHSTTSTTTTTKGYTAAFVLALSGVEVSAAPSTRLLSVRSGYSILHFQLPPPPSDDGANNASASAAAADECVRVAEKIEQGRNAVFDHMLAQVVRLLDSPPAAKKEE